MNQRLKSVLKISLPIILGVVLVWYSFTKISPEKLWEYAKEADYSWIIFGVVLGFLSHLSRAYRWNYLLEPLGHRARFANSFMAVMAAYLINYTIPRAGEIGRATILTNYEKVPFDKGFGTIVSERVADMVVMLGIIGITLFLEFDYIYQLLVERFDPLKVAIGILALIILALVFILIIQRVENKFTLAVRKFVKGVIDGIMSIFKMKNKWPFIFHTLFIWAMYLLMFYVTTFSIEQTSGIPFAAVLIGFISASFSIAATNGGVGSYPVFVAAAFSIFGIAAEPSTAFGYLMWGAQTLMIFILGGISLIYLPIYNRLNPKTNE